MQSVETRSVPLDCELELAHLEGNGTHYHVSHSLSVNQLVYECLVALWVANGSLESQRSLHHLLLHRLLHNHHPLQISLVHSVHFLLLFLVLVALLFFALLLVVAVITIVF